MSCGWNDNPRPFIRHKTAEQILDTLASIAGGSATQITSSGRGS